MTYDFVKAEVEWSEHAVGRLRRLRQLEEQDGHWGEESAEFADLIDAFRNADAMCPVPWWRK